jgi:hypothetical protein
MLNRLALLGGSVLIVAGSFMFADSVLERGFEATLLAMYRFFNP